MSKLSATSPVFREVRNLHPWQQSAALGCGIDWVHYQYGGIVWAHGTISSELWDWFSLRSLCEGFPGTTALFGYMR